MSWLVLAIVAAAIWGWVNIIDKYVLNKLIDGSSTSFLLRGPMMALPGFLIFLFKGFGNLSLFNTIIAFVCGIFVALVTYFYLKAVKIEEISRVVPIFFLGPALIALLAAIFLNEIFAPIIYLGIFLLIIGAILISTRHIFKIRFNKALFWMLIATFFYALSAVLIKYLLKFTDFWTIFAYSSFSTIFIWIPLFIYNFKDFKLIFKKSGFKPILIISFSEILNLSARAINFFAISIGSLALVESLGSTQPFFVLFYSVILSLFFPKIIKEEIKKSIIMLKVLAVLIMFVGALLIIQ